MTPGRLPAGGRIDRSRRLDVAFDGEPLPAHPGDTLASAVLAAGRLVVGRSVLHGRPRGIAAAGSEEPTGIAGIVAPLFFGGIYAATVEEGSALPWPGLSFLIAALLLLAILLATAAVWLANETGYLRFDTGGGLDAVQRAPDGSYVIRGY